MRIASTNFAITLVCKRKYDVILWRCKQRISSNNDHRTLLLNTIIWQGAYNQAVAPHITRQGRSQTFSFGGATGGASFATRGAVNGLCRTFRKRPTERDLILGGPGKIGGAVAPLGTLLSPLLSPDLCSARSWSLTFSDLISDFAIKNACRKSMQRNQTPL